MDVQGLQRNYCLDFKPYLCPTLTVIYSFFAGVVHNYVLFPFHVCTHFEINFFPIEIQTIILLFSTDESTSVIVYVCHLTLSILPISNSTTIFFLGGKDYRQ